MLECKGYSGFASGPIWRYSELVPKLPSFFLTPLPRYGVKAGHVTTTKMVCPKNPATALFDTAYSFLITWSRDAKKTIVAWNSNWSSFLLFYSNLGNPSFYSYEPVFTIHLSMGCRNWRNKTIVRLVVWFIF